MGDIIPFDTKKKKKVLDIPKQIEVNMMFTLDGIGIAANLLADVLVAQDNILYFRFDDGNVYCAIEYDDRASAENSAQELVYIMKTQYGKNVRILYE